MDETAKQLRVVVSAPRYNELYVSNLRFRKSATQEEMNADKAAQLAVLEAKYAFNEANSAPVSSTGIWDAAPGGNFGRAWDATAGKMKVNMNTPNAALTFRPINIWQPKRLGRKTRTCFIP